MQQESCVPDRLMLAYFLIALMVIAFAVTVWHLTKARRAHARSRRAHQRSKQKATN
jgi:Flp pilus assembly protein TadB